MHVTPPPKTTDPLPSSDGASPTDDYSDLGPEAMRRRLAFLVQRLARSERERRVAEEAAVRDSLTGLFNWRAFDEARKRGGAVLLADVSSLHAANNERGQVFGDVVLRRAGSKLLRLAADAGIGSRRCFRLGGDEFAIVCSAPDGRRVLEGIRERLAGLDGRVARIRGGQRALDLWLVAAVADSYGAAARQLVIAKQLRRGDSREGGRPDARPSVS